MSLKELFEEYTDRDWIFAAPGGNQGDHMIYRGAFKLADQVRLKYRKLFYKKGTSVHIFDKNIMIYLHGGGGFTPWWNWSPLLIRKLREANPRNHIIVGPTSVDTNRDYLDRILDLDDRTTFFARERTTFDVIQNYSADVRLDHDTSLNLTRSDYTMPLSRDYDLLALRSDEEGGLLPTFPPKRYCIVDPVLLRGDWLRCHAKARSIITNRSHSGILGAILGKETTMFAGRYHKNRSIWEYSLKDIGVKWLE